MSVLSPTYDKEMTKTVAQRIIIFGLAVAVLSWGYVLLTSSELLAKTWPEREELTVPDYTPHLISNKSTNEISFTMLVSDYSLSRPRIQFWDAASNEWRTATYLKDNGKNPDISKKDAYFAGSIKIIPQKDLLVVADSVRGRAIGVVASSSVVLRLAALRKSEKIMLVSPAFSVFSSDDRIITLSSGNGEHPISLALPRSFEVIASDPSRLIVEKKGVNGYRFTIRVDDNSQKLPLEEWIIACNFFASLRPCGPLKETDPHTLKDYNAQSSGNIFSTANIVIGEYSGFKLKYQDSESMGYEVYLDDTALNRVFAIEIYPHNSDQLRSFEMNSVEAINILRSITQ